MKRARWHHGRGGRRGFWIALLSMLLMAGLHPLAGCSDDTGDAPAVTKRVAPARRAAPKVQAVPADKGQADVPAAPAEAAGGDEEAWRPRAERDPFKSFVQIRTTTSGAPAHKARKILTPLQRYSLDQLTVVGIVRGGSTRKALLEDDVGKGYVVTEGEAVGNQGGKLVAIQKDRIIIEESYRDVMGAEKVRQITKRLYSAEQGENP